MSHSTVGTKFYYYNGVTPTQIYGIITKPPMRGAPARLDATSQEDTETQSAAGVRQTGDQNVQFKYNTEGGVYNYDTFIALEGVKTKYGIAYPDGKALEWEAEAYVQRDGTGVNALDTFTVAMFAKTGTTELTAPALTIPGGTLGSLLVSTAAGTTGKSVITLTPTLIPGMPYVYKTGVAAPACIYDQDLSDAGWAPIVSGQSITVTNGYYITVAGVDASFKAKRKGTAICVSGS